MDVKIINHSAHSLPAYETTSSAGMDLKANIDAPIEIKPLERKLIPTGIFIELPIGFEAQIRPRSGMAFKHGITVLNSPGTIDADYRGEVKVIVCNVSNEPYTIENGDRVAQMVVAKHERVDWVPVEMLEETSRGAGGFGHTGKR